MPFQYIFRLAIGVLALYTPTCWGVSAIATYDENSPNPFTAADYAAPGAVTTTSDSIVVDVTSSASFVGAAGAFFDVPIDFNTDDYQWELRIRVLEQNNVPFIGAVYHDEDPDVVNSESWITTFDISTLTTGDGYVTLRQPLTNPIHVDMGGDGIQNPDLRSVSLVGASPTGGHLHVEVDYLSIVPIPEPATGTAMAIAASALILWRRRLR